MGFSIIKGVNWPHGPTTQSSSSVTTDTAGERNPDGTNR
jgi:hypothetical protein